jgi:hypothetical protein
MLLRIGHKRGDGMSLSVHISGVSGVFYKLIDACGGIRDRSGAGLPNQYSDFHQAWSLRNITTVEPEPRSFSRHIQAGDGDYCDALLGRHRF